MPTTELWTDPQDTTFLMHLPKETLVEIIFALAGYYTANEQAKDDLQGTLDVILSK